MPVQYSGYNRPVLTEIDCYIIANLYNSWCGRDHDAETNINRMLEVSGYDKIEFHKRIDRLSNELIIRPYSLAGHYEITPVGIAYADANQISDSDSIAENRQVRHTILVALSELYEESGPWADQDIRTFHQELRLD